MRNDLVATLIVVLGVVGCGNEPKKPDPTELPHDFQIEVEVTDTDGKVVPAAPVKLDGKTIGYTGRDGTFTATLRDKPGTEITLGLGEIEGYRIVDKGSVTEKLELKRSLSGKGYQGVPVLLHAVTESVQRRYLVWVDAECDDSLPEDACKGLPVERNGKVVATTDRLGMAHFNLHEQPDATLSVTIDTPAAPKKEENGDDGEGPTFKPTDPSYEISLGLEPTVYHLKPTFQDPTAEQEDQHVYRPPSPDPEPEPEPEPEPTSSESGGRRRCPARSCGR